MQASFWFWWLACHKAEPSSDNLSPHHDPLCLYPQLRERFTSTSITTQTHRVCADFIIADPHVYTVPCWRGLYLPLLSPRPRQGLLRVQGNLTETLFMVSMFSLLWFVGRNRLNVVVVYRLLICDCRLNTMVLWCTPNMSWFLWADSYSFVTIIIVILLC